LDPFHSPQGAITADETIGICSSQVGNSRFGFKSNVAGADILIRSPLKRSVVVIPISTLSQSARYATAIATCIAVIGWYSPAGAAAQDSDVSFFPDLPVRSTPPNDNSDAVIGVQDRNRTLALTSRLPWRAPIGHRQPRRADIQLDDSISEWERQQDRLNRELDRKLIICRGC